MKAKVIALTGTLLSASLVLLVALGSARPQGSKNPVPQIEINNTNIGIIFKHNKNTRKLHGIISHDSSKEILSQISKSHLSTYNKDFDYEIWITQNNKATGIWYDSFSKEAGIISHSSNAGPADKGDKKLGELLCSALSKINPIKIEKSDKYRFKTIGSSDHATPESLADICNRAQVIASGTIVGVIRRAHSPVNSTDIAQHTVYAMAVDTYLKTDEQGAAPILKIWNNGGDLPWSNADLRTEGVGMTNLNDPLLNVGNRYLLFLKRPSDPSGFFKSKGYILSEYNGVAGPVAHLDEYFAVSPLHGKVLLQDGQSLSATLVAPVSNPSDENWTFSDGTTLVRRPETQIFQEVRLLLQPRKVDGDSDVRSSTQKTH